MGALDNLIQSKTTKKTSALDSLIQAPKQIIQPVKKVSPVKLSESIGGGGFNAPGVDLVTSTRGYPMQSETDSWREHIIPVALGGTSSGDNVKLYGKEQGLEKTKFENEQIKLFKAGKLSLPEARANILAKHRQIIGIEPTPEQTKQKGGTGFIGKAIDKIYNIFTKSKGEGVLGQFIPSPTTTPTTRIEESKQFKEGLSATPIGKYIEMETKFGKDFLTSVKDLFTKPGEASKQIAKLAKDPKKLDELAFALTGEPLANVGKGLLKKGIQKIEQPIIQEAKKYKSAEEFVKAQSKYVHETNATDIKQFDKSKIGTGQGEAWLGQGIYLQEKGSFKFEKYGKNNVEAGLMPDAKIFKIQETPNGKWRDSFVEWYAKNHPNFEKSLEMWQNPKNVLPRDFLKNKGEYDFGTPTVIKELRDAGYDGLLQDGELVVYNLDILKTKSQLTDIWNKAQEKVPEVKPAIQKIIDTNPREPQDFLAWQKAEADKIRAESVPFYNDFETENNFQTFKNLLSDKRFSNPKVKEALLSKDAQSFKAELESRGVMSKIEADNLLYSQEKGDNSVFDEFVARVRDENPELLSSKRIAQELGQIKSTPKVEIKPLQQKKSIQPVVQDLPSSRTPAQELSAIQKQELLRLESQQPTAQVLPGFGHILERETSYKKLLNDLPTDLKNKVNILDYIRTPDRVLNKIGLGNEAKVLRTQYEKYIKELPQEIGKISDWAKQVNAEDNVNIFRYLDGQAVKLNEKSLKVANEIKEYLANWADKLKLPKENRITNYITHIFDEEMIKKEFPEELAKIISNKIPGSVYDPFTLQRLGKYGYIEDTWRALDAYVKRGVRKYNMDPVLEKIKEASKSLEKSQFDYVKSFIDKVNLRPSDIDNITDNLIKQIPSIEYKLGQRPTARITKLGRQWVYRGALGLNVSSALRNLSQGVNTYAKLGERYTLRGYTDMLKNWNGEELEKVGVLGDDIIQDRQLSAIKSVMEKADKGLFYLFQTVEKINRGAAYYGAKAKALKEGKTFDEAVEAGKKMVRDTQFVFGSIDTPVWLQNDIMKVFSQFQSFTVKQTEFLAEMIAKKEIAGLARYAGSSLLFIYTIGQAFGMNPKDLIPTLRFGGPPALKPLTTTAGAVLGTPDKYGQPRTIAEKVRDVASTVVPFIPGGVQLKKTLQGLGVYARGKKTNAKGKTTFKVKQNLSNLIRSGLFGQYATKEAKEYYKK